MGKKDLLDKLDDVKRQVGRAGWEEPSLDSYAHDITNIEEGIEKLVDIMHEILEKLP